MRRRRPGIGSELLPVALILASLAGTLGLVMLMQKRSATPPGRAAGPPHAAELPPAPVVVVASRPPARTPKVAEPAPAPAKPDPTVAVLADLATATAEQARAAHEADRKAEALEAARKGAEAESARRRRREALVKAQLGGLADQAERLEAEADALAHERDVLAQERDASRAALQKARAVGGGYAVLPNKSPNGTWQRPVVIECRDGQAVLQPRGLAFSLLDMSPLLGLRGSPLVGAVARELLTVQRAAAPDGAPVVPYIYFVVRPDGVRAFYDARSRLEPLGIAFGYELVEQDWAIDFPDFDALDAWDGSQTASPAGEAGRLARNAPVAGSGRRGGERHDAPEEGGEAFLWPADRPARAAGTGAGTERTQGVEENPFLWPRRPVGSNPGSPGSGLGTSETAGVNDRPLPPRVTRQGFGAPSQPGPSGPGGSSGPTATPEGDGLVSLGSRGLPGLEPAGAGPMEKPAGAGSAGVRPKRPASGRVRIDPMLLAEAAAASEAEAEELEAGRPPLAPYSAGARPLPTPPLPALSPEAGGLLSDPGGTNLASNPSTSGVVELPLEAEVANAPPADGARTPQGSTATSPSTAATAANPPSRVGGPPSTGRTSANLATTVPAAGTPPSASASAPPATKPPPGLRVDLPSFGRPGASQGDSHPQQADASPPKPPPPPSDAIRLPLNLVVACGPEGVVIHPGGYRLSTNGLRKDGMLRRDLEAIVRNHALIDAKVIPVPRVQFLIEAGGAETYAEARRGTVLSDLGWPVSVRVAEASATAARVFPKERF